uniref:Uncharacterized protein n=1 Tax=Glossina pallidipes TaxID=7398 RepID=A0A1A9ZYW1_GLOPL
MLSRVPNTTLEITSYNYMWVSSMLVVIVIDFHSISFLIMQLTSNASFKNKGEYKTPLWYCWIMCICSQLHLEYGGVLDLYLRLQHSTLRMKVSIGKESSAVLFPTGPTL